MQIQHPQASHGAGNAHGHPPPMQKSPKWRKADEAINFRILEIQTCRHIVQFWPKAQFVGPGNMDDEGFDQDFYRGQRAYNSRSYDQAASFLKKSLERHSIKAAALLLAQIYYKTTFVGHSYETSLEFYHTALQTTPSG